MECECAGGIERNMNVKLLRDEYKRVYEEWITDDSTLTLPIGMAELGHTLVVLGVDLTTLIQEVNNERH